MVELLVGSSIGAFLTITAVAFAQHQTRLVADGEQSLWLSQGSRAGLERLAYELRQAGVGVGYKNDGSFAGLELGTFARGGAQFGSNNQVITTAAGNTFTDDVGIVFATGGYATIASYNAGGSAQICRGSGIVSGEKVIIRSEDGLSARSVLIGNVAAATCVAGVCVGGCDEAQFSTDSTFSSGVDATNANYQGGEMAGGFKRVTWFVEASDTTQPGIGRLRRVEGDCTARNNTCGEVIADYVESLQMRVYERANGAWVDRTDNGAAIDGDNRLRVDLEMVLRARSDKGTKQLPVQMALEPSMCLPGCGTKDNVYRKVIRTSVELKNTGRMRYRRMTQ